LWAGAVGIVIVIIIIIVIMFITQKDEWMPLTDIDFKKV